MTVSICLSEEKTECSRSQWKSVQVVKSWAAGFCHTPAHRDTKKILSHLAHHRVSLYSLCLCALWPTNGTLLKWRQAGREASQELTTQRHDPNELSTPCLHSSPCSSQRHWQVGEDEHLIPDTHLGLARPSRSQPGDASETCSCAWGPSCCHTTPQPTFCFPCSSDPWSSRVFHRCYFSQSPLTG